MAMQEEQISRHRRVASLQNQFERHTYGAVPTQNNGGGYLFEHERKQSLAYNNHTKFTDLIKKIDDKLATNRAKRTRSRGSRLDSIGAGSRNDSLNNKRQDAEGNYFRVQGVSINKSNYMDERRSCLDQGTRMQVQDVNRQVSGPKELPKLAYPGAKKRTYTQRYFQPLQNNLNQNLEVNIKVEVRAKPNQEEYSDRYLHTRRHTHNSQQAAEFVNNPYQVTRQINIDQYVRKQSRPLDRQPFVERSYNDGEMISQNNHNRVFVTKRPPSREIQEIVKIFCSPEASPQNDQEEDSDHSGVNITPVQERQREINDLLRDPVCAFLYGQMNKKSNQKIIKDVLGPKYDQKRSQSLARPKFSMVMNKLL